MADIERFTPDDRRGIEQLHRRTLGNEAAERLRLHWDWARRNPANGVEPPYWVVREGPTLIAASSLTAVRVSLAGTEVAGTWSSDPLVVAERQRQGLGRRPAARVGSRHRHRAWRGAVGGHARAPRRNALAPGAAAALSRQATEPPRIPHPDVAGADQSLRLGGHAADRPGRVANAAAQGRSGGRPPLRCAASIAYGSAWRAGSRWRSARRALLELEVRRTAARALHDRRCCGVAMMSTATWCTGIFASRRAA